MTNTNQMMKRIDLGNRIKADTAGTGNIEIGTITEFNKRDGIVTFRSVVDGTEIMINRSAAMKCTKAEFDAATGQQQEEAGMDDEMMIAEQEETETEDLTMEDLEAEELETDEESEEGTDGRSIVPRKYRDLYKARNAANGIKDMDCGDALASTLRGKKLEEVYEIAAEALEVGVEELKAKYSHLNNGQQRMVLGNRIRNT